MAFAQIYDPQPLHTDPVAAAEEAFGGLIASGFQTIALGFGQFIRLGLFEGVSLGGPVPYRLVLEFGVTRPPAG